MRQFKSCCHSLLLFLFFLSNPLFSQQLPFAHLSIGDGLEDTVVFSIEQDDLGFLWITTRTGINRFDGEQFWTYSSKHGLPHNLARRILKTTNGRLYVATELGVAWFDGQSFIAIKDWPESVSARDLAEDSNGDLWVATYGAGLLKVTNDSEPKIVDSIDFHDKLPSDRVRTVFIDSKQNIWAGFSNKIAKISYPEKVVERLPWNHKESEIRTIFESENGEIWAGTRSGVSYFDGQAFEPLEFDVDLQNQTINTIKRDEIGNIWVGSRDFGVYQFNSQRQMLTHFNMDNGLPDNSVNIIYQDKESNLWFGTYGAGIARLSTSKVLNWKAQPGLPNPNVYTITKDQKDCIWIGTNGNGVSRLCGSEMMHYTREDGLPHNKVLSSMIDSNGSAWFGTLQGLSHLKEGEFVNYDQDDGLTGSVVYHMVEMDDGTFWIGTNNGLNHFDGEKFIDYNMSHGLPNNRINRILKRPDGSLWIASSNGLTLFKDGVFTNWSTKDGLAANFINDFYEDSNQRLWIATNNGLSLFDKGEFTNWDRSTGLPHDNCTSVAPGKNGEIWIGTSRGVAIFNGDTFTVITSREGLVFDLVNRGAGYRDEDGNLWFGTGEGISRFSNDFKPGSSVPPPVHLLSVSNDLNQLKLNGIHQIPQAESNLNFKFTAVSFQRAPDVNYRYRLKSKNDQTWRETRLRELQINSLAPGDYNFEVTARIGKGQWNDIAASFSFTITPPFWRTPWFLLLVGLSILIAIIYRSYRASKHAQHLENLVRERTQQLEDLNEGLDWMANHDSLTKLANRNQVQERLEQLQSSDDTFGILIIDLDYFKSINDEFGHAAGDKVLQAFAELLQGMIRNDQLAARWGGEEFLILCPQINTTRIQSLARQVLHLCRKLKVKVSGSEISVKCSVGFAMSQQEQDLNQTVSTQKLIQLADMALYEAKNNGRDQAVGFLWMYNKLDDFDPNKTISNHKELLSEGTIIKVNIKD